MFTLLADHKATLNQLAELIEAEKTCAAEIYSEGSYADDKKRILDIASQKTGEKFIVLIIGAFACGKTSMINALIGEDLLPTGFLPETAVLRELHYGSQKRITLYPKKGMWEGNDEPFDLREVTTEEIRKYGSLSTDDAINSMEKNIDGDESQSRINAKFEKMIIYWPLDILKDGVVLVDSPGINDPYSNDYIVNDYLPKADAIVYVMNSTKAYMKFDKDYLEKINALAHKNIITAHTFYDIVEKQLRRQPEKLRTLRKMLINYMMRHTNLGEESIHFLDSIGGLDAKLDDDREGLRKSGFEGFEDYLGQYLVESKGSAQVRNIFSTIVIQADTMIKDAQFLNNATAQIDLSKTLAEAQEHLKAARIEAQQKSKNYRQSLENRLPAVEQKIRTFLTKELPERINLEGFQPETSLPTGLEKLNPFGFRKKAKALRDEYQQEVLRRINFEFKVWANNNLNGYFAIDKFAIILPASLFLYINVEAFHIISHDINSAEKIKFLVVKYAKEFFRDVSTREEVDNMVSDIMSDVKDYVEKTCAGAEKIFRDEVENTERLIRRIVEDGKATLEEKTAQIKQRTAAVDKLNGIKDKALQIGRDHGIRF